MSGSRETLGSCCLHWGERCCGHQWEPWRWRERSAVMVEWPLRATTRSTRAVGLGGKASKAVRTGQNHHAWGGRMDWEGLTMARLLPTTTHAPAVLGLALSSVRPWGQSPRQASSAWSPPPWLRLHGQFPPLGGCILGSCSGCLDPLLLTSPFSLTPGAAFPKSCLGPPHHPEGGPLELGCPWPCRGR